MTRIEVVFVSLVALLLGIILLVLGGCLTLSPYYALPLHALAVFAKKPLFAGVMLSLVGFCLLLAFRGLTKRRYLRFKTEGYSISEEVLTELAKHHLRQHYPEATCDVQVKKGEQLEVTAHLSVPPEEFERVAALLEKAFAETCGYTDPFRLELLVK